MGADGEVQGIQQFSAFDKPQTSNVDPTQAQGLSMQQYAEKMKVNLSSHRVSHGLGAERSAEQQQGICFRFDHDPAWITALCVSLQPPVRLSCY
ncbi:hypothetical protein [Xanthomonas arboricola]|uniref:hypothetical protein n=1 Tax=Xanthomonas arboricola TaxID=56448 RepID=UPI001EE89913|nr:hypothetical protein [Xanthomonas arboricola]